MRKDLLKGLVIGGVFGIIVGLLITINVSVVLNYKNNLLGSWQDDVSQRANLTVYDQGYKFYIKASWAQSATERTIWEMTADFDEKSKSFVYKDCECIHLGRDIETNKPIYDQEYTDGSGKIILQDNKLNWKADNDESIKKCRFIKIP